MENTIRLKQLIDKAFAQYERKNHDYGNSVYKTATKYGQVTLLARIADKFHRLETLMLNKDDHKVVDESLQDTLVDLATYALITAVHLQSQKPKTFLPQTGDKVRVLVPINGRVARFNVGDICEIVEPHYDGDNIGYIVQSPSNTHKDGMIFMPSYELEFLGKEEK